MRTFSIQSFPSIYHHSSWASKWKMNDNEYESSATYLNFYSPVKTNADIIPQGHLRTLLCKPHLCQTGPNIRREIRSTFEWVLYIFEIWSIFIHFGQYKGQTLHLKKCILIMMTYPSQSSWKCIPRCAVKFFHFEQLTTTFRKQNASGWLSHWISQTLLTCVTENRNGDEKPQNC